MSLVILQLGDFWNIRIVLGELGDVSFGTIRLSVVRCFLVR